MNGDSGWLQRSLERAHENIQSRPMHLQPRRYRDAEAERLGQSESSLGSPGVSSPVRDEQEED